MVFDTGKMSNLGQCGIDPTSACLSGKAGSRVRVADARIIMAGTGA
jgi:hypothetical protein